MGVQSPFKDHPHPLRKKLLPYGIYALLLLALIRLYFSPLSTSLPCPTTIDHQPSPHETPILISTFPPPSKVFIQEEGRKMDGCDYTNGKWVHDKMGPLYNSTACGTIKDGQNCMSHGRPDMDYLYWKWKPNKCQLPRFDPTAFLHLSRDRHVAFVGDSIARNQLESLLCLLATVSLPHLVFSKEDNKFRKWHFPSHNVTLSVYWSPFLVKGIEKSEETLFNRLYLDSVNEIWARDLGEIDMVVLSIGHWFLHPAVFYHGESVIGCHSCTGQNHTEVGFYEAFGEAFNTTLATAASVRRRRLLDVVVTTFSPAHFEGEWDRVGACAKTKPENERGLEGMDDEMRKRQMEQVAAAKGIAGKLENFRLEALDVSKLALMRPDGHPGPYMYPFPFANGPRERVPNDCVHWCLPGPIDTWNEIMLDIMKRWSH